MMGGYEYTPEARRLREVEDERNRLRRQRDAVLALHPLTWIEPIGREPGEADRPWCDTCSVPHPCQTYLAVAPF